MSQDYEIKLWTGAKGGGGTAAEEEKMERANHGCLVFRNMKVGGVSERAVPVSENHHSPLTTSLVLQRSES